MATLLQIRSQRFSRKPLSSPSTPLKEAKIIKFRGSISKPRCINRRLRVRAVKVKTEEIKNPSSAEEVTKKYGLEAGLWKVGISTDETGEKVGTFVLAYAAHKAASPFRFPPTVALTPIIASWISKKVDQEK